MIKAGRTNPRPSFGGTPPRNGAGLNLELLQATFELVQIAFVFAFGACIGSLINVLVYRLPLGLDVVTPTSRCPCCNTKLTWRENIPVFGWLLLRGRCRFCKSGISAEYPIVETIVGLMFVGLFLMLYSSPAAPLGFSLAAAQPRWAFFGIHETWPFFILWLILISCLTAMTIIDARTFQIPLVLTWVPAAAALVFHPAFAAWYQWHSTHGGGTIRFAKGWAWAMATPASINWWLIGASIGGCAGLVIANILLAKGIFRRSFANYEEWEAKALAEAKLAEGVAAEAEDGKGRAGAIAEPQDAPQMWIQYPHARREMMKEIVFLLPCALLAIVGGWVATHLVSWHINPISGLREPDTTAPLWLMVLAGVCLGYLIGGGIVWATRILGSLAFGKEAMGLGDVHLMAGVGACLGWIDATLAFFGATFVGLFWAIASRLFSGVFKRAMPFGPYLAISTCLVIVCKPLIEKGLDRMMPLLAPIHLP